MSGNRFVLAGFEEMKAQLRALPEHLAHEAGSIVTRHAAAAADKIRESYPQRQSNLRNTGRNPRWVPPGNLRKGVKLEPAKVSGAGASARVRSTAHHAWLYENGSAARHWRGGKSTGVMPAAHVVIRTAVAERREMEEDLIGLVQTEGFTVKRV